MMSRVVDRIRQLRAIPWLNRLIGVSLLAGCLAFLWKRFLGIDLSTSLDLVGGNAALLLFSMALLYGLILIFLAIAWCALADPERRLTRPGMVALYGRSVLPKYLPGGVLHYGSRQWLGGAAGLSQRAMAKATGVEIALHLLLATIVALAGASVAGLLPGFGAGMAVIALAALAGMANRLVGRGATISVVMQAVFFVSFWAISFIVAWAIVGAPATAGKLATIFLVGWMAGFILPFVPGGIGVREAAIVALGASVASPAVLLSFAALMRVVTLGGDLWLGLASYFVPLAETRAKKQAPAGQ